MCAPSMFKHVVGNHKADIFIHTWSKHDHRPEGWSIDHGGHSTVDPNEIADIYSPVELVVEPSPEGDMPGASPANMFRKVFLCDAMRRTWSERTGISHQVVMRMRSDLLFINPFPWDEYEAGALHIPHGEDHGGINDQLAWGPPDVMRDYSHVGDRKFGNTTQPEQMLKDHLNGGAEARRPFVKYRIVRMQEAERSGFVRRRPTVESTAVETTGSPPPYGEAPATKVRPIDPAGSLPDLVTPLRCFWTADRYSGNRDGVDALVEGLTAGLDERRSDLLIIDALDRLRNELTGRFRSCTRVYPFKHDDLHLDVQESSYDVVMVASLQHVPSRRVRNTILMEALRAMKPGGTLSMQMGHGPGGFTHYLADGPISPSQLGHVLLDDREPLLTDLAQIGFERLTSSLKPPGQGDGQKAWLFVKGKRPDRSQPSDQATDLSTQGTAHDAQEEGTATQGPGSNPPP